MTGRARPGETSLSADVPIQYKRVYLWHWATRSMHWVSVTCILVLAVTGFYIADGLDLRWMWWGSVSIGVVGLVLYYVVAFAYLGDMRTAIATSEAAETGR